MNFSPAEARRAVCGGVHVRPRRVLVAQHVDGRLPVAAGDAGEAAGQPAGQDVRRPRRLRLLRHLQHGVEVEPRAHDEQDGEEQRAGRTVLLVLVRNLGFLALIFYGANRFEKNAF